MKKCRILIIGILLLIISFVWMLIAKASTGPFLILAGISGLVTVKGIDELKK